MVAATHQSPRDMRTFLDPMRDPAWRSVRAQYLATRHQGRYRRPSQRDDEAIRTYRRFLIAWNTGDASTRDRLYVEDPGLYFAHKFRQHPDKEWQAIIEAKMLAREADEFIAAEFSTCLEAVRWYHDLFFDVRDRLHSRMYIAKIILGPAARRITDHDDVMTDNLRHLCYKNFAYHGGPLVLDLLVTGFTESGMFPHKTSQVDGWLDTAFKASVKRRSNMTSQTFTVDRWKCMELMQMHITLMGQAQAALTAGGGGAITEYHQNIEMFFDQMPIAIGARSAEGRRPEQLKFEHTYDEPRADEMLLLAEGKVPQRLLSQSDYRPPAEEAGHERTDGQDV